MIRSKIAGLVFAALGVALASGGCSGKVGTVNGADGGGGSSGGGSGSGGSGGGSGSSSGGVGTGCVYLPLSRYDTSCGTDSDCVTVTTGNVCNGDCLCGGSAINVASEGEWKTDVSSVLVGECGCPAEPLPRCIASTCTVCTGGPSDPPGCSTGIADSGTITVDATTPACVYILPSTYSTSCNVDSDCTLLPEGQVCSGNCECGGSPVNRSGEAAFQMLTAGITFAQCPCVAPPPIRCVMGTCAQCAYGSDGGAVCGDGG